MLPNESNGRCQGPPPETVVLGQFDIRIEPELRFSSITLNMNVKPRFFP